MKVIYLTEEQYEELLADGTTTTTGGVTINYNDNDMYCVEDNPVKLYKHTFESMDNVLTIVTNNPTPISYISAYDGLNVDGHVIMSVEYFKEILGTTYGCMYDKLNYGTMLYNLYYIESNEIHQLPIGETGFDTDQVEELS